MVTVGVGHVLIRTTHGMYKNRVERYGSMTVEHCCATEWYGYATECCGAFGRARNGCLATARCSFPDSLTELDPEVLRWPTVPCCNCALGIPSGPGRPTFRPSVRPSVCLSVCLSVCPSVLCLCSLVLWCRMACRREEEPFLQCHSICRVGQASDDRNAIVNGIVGLITYSQVGEAM